MSNTAPIKITNPTHPVLSGAWLSPAAIHARPRPTRAATASCTCSRTPGHSVVAYHLVKDEPAKIKAKIKSAVADKKVQAIIINGGTGISRRDSTFEAVDAMLEKRLDGFGEVFRYLTYQEIGSPAIA